MLDLVGEILLDRISYHTGWFTMRALTRGYLRPYDAPAGRKQKTFTRLPDGAWGVERSAVTIFGLLVWAAAIGIVVVVAWA